jgi:hypothetical protein
MLKLRELLDFELIAAGSLFPSGGVQAGSFTRILMHVEKRAFLRQIFGVGMAL